MDVEFQLQHRERQRVKSQPKIINNLIIGTFVFVISGCQTTRETYSEHKEGQWNVQSFITSPAKKLNQFEVALDIAAIKDQKIRLDAISPLGTIIGSLILTRKEAVVIDFENRRAFRGDSSAKAMQKLVEVPLEPRIFHNLLFDTPIVSDNWTCDLGKKGRPEKCSNSSNGVKITWDQKLVGTKVIRLEQGSHSVQMKFKSFTPEISNKQRRFQIRIPKSYKTLRL